MGNLLVAAMDLYLQIRGQTQGYFFIHSDRVPLTKYQFWKLTNLAFKKIGVHRMRFGTHFFRIETATIAAALDYNIEDIKRLGRWSSSTYHRYNRTLPNV